MNRPGLATSILGVFAAILALSLPQHASADIVPFILDGQAGPGILSANENPAIGGGSGGITAGGVLFDTDTNELTINVGWGSGQGFTDLTSAVSLLNLHGPTADAAPVSYTQNANGLISPGGVNTSPTNGGFSGIVTINPGNVTDLLTGRIYLHIHTDQNSGGEARGYLIAVPEPGGLMLLVFGLVTLLAVRRRPR